MSSPSLVDVGVLRSTLLPNLQFHAALAIPAYILSRASKRVNIKDYLWFGGQAAIAWWTAIGRNVLIENVPLRAALNSISRPRWILLAGVSMWSARGLYRLFSRSMVAPTEQVDDPRYESLRTDPTAWNTTIPIQFLVEAVVQALITLPFTAPYRNIPGLGIRGDNAVFEAVAIGLWSAGLAMETLADTQLMSHQKNQEPGLLRSGVWSIVRHPNYFGDALTQLAYPLFLFSHAMFNPVTLLGPIANWFFLRHIGGDKENEQHQEEKYARDDPLKRVELAEYRDDKNAFWPGLKEITNPWTWVVVASGAAGVVAAKTIPRYFNSL